MAPRLVVVPHSKKAVLGVDWAVVDGATMPLKKTLLVFMFAAGCVWAPDWGVPISSDSMAFRNKTKLVSQLCDCREI